MTNPPPDPRPAAAPAPNTDRLISTILRGGVVLSLALVSVGVGLTFLRQPTLLSTPFHAGAQPGTPRTFGQILASALALEGPGLIMLGVLFLIGTPVLRVAASIAAYARQRDWRYVVITTVVLVLMVTAFVVGWWMR